MFFPTSCNPPNGIIFNLEFLKKLDITFLLKKLTIGFNKYAKMKPMINGVKKPIKAFKYV